MTSTAAFIARLIGLLAAAVATLAVAVGVIGSPSTQGGNPQAAAPGTETDGHQTRSLSE